LLAKLLEHLSEWLCRFYQLALGIDLLQVQCCA
jgi:hypothetical protein